MARYYRLISTTAILLLLLLCVSCENASVANPDLSPETSSPTTDLFITPVTTQKKENDNEVSLPDESEVPKAQLPDPSASAGNAASQADSPATNMTSPTPSPVDTPTPSHVVSQSPSPTPTASRTPTPKPTSEKTPAPVPTLEKTPAPEPTTETTPEPATEASETPSATPDKPDELTNIDVETKNGFTTVSGKCLPDAALEIIDQINSEREAAGLTKLEHDSNLFDTSLTRSAEITILWSHTRPNGKEAVDVSKGIYGEILAKGYDTSSSVVKAWMGSDGHRSLILKSNFNTIGASVLKVDKIIYWVVHFGV